MRSFPKRVTVEITRQMAYDGCPANSEACPLSAALRADGYADAKVLGGRRIYLSHDSQVYAGKKRLARALNNFDRHETEESRAALIGIWHLYRVAHQ